MRTHHCADTNERPELGSQTSAETLQVMLTVPYGDLGSSGIRKQNRVRKSRRIDCGVVTN